MNTLQIALVNKATVALGVDLSALAQALQKQVSRDFAPIWQTDVNLVLLDDATDDYDNLILFDNADQAGELGYHDLSPKGHAYGKVFVKTSQADNESVSSVASHELLEMLLDPYVNLSAQDNATLWAYEAADMVENDEYNIVIPAGWTGAGRSVPVSNFAYPNWWQAGKPGPWDFLQRLKSPLQLTAGGYMSFLDLNRPGNGWQQINGRMDSSAQTVRSRPRAGSRRERRNIPRSERIISTYQPGTEAIEAEAA